MADSKKAVGLVVALLVMGLMAAFLFPVVIDTFSGQETATFNQSVGEEVTLQPDLTSTLDSSNSGANATYTINASGNTATTTINEGSNDTVTVDGTDVTIAVDDASASNATATYTYDGTYGWGGGASALWTIIPVLLVLSVFLFFVAVALNEL